MWYIAISSRREFPMKNPYKKTFVTLVERDDGGGKSTFPILLLPP